MSEVPRNDGTLEVRNCVFGGGGGEFLKVTNRSYVMHKYLLLYWYFKWKSDTFKNYATFLKQ